MMIFGYSLGTSTSIDLLRIETGLEEISMTLLFSTVLLVILGLLSCQSKEEVTHGVICRNLPFLSKLIGSSPRLPGQANSHFSWFFLLLGLLQIISLVRFKLVQIFPRLTLLNLRTFGSITLDVWIKFHMLGSLQLEIIIVHRSSVQNSSSSEEF